MIEYIFGGIALFVSVICMMMARHFYIETRKIELRFRSRREHDAEVRKVQPRRYEWGTHRGNIKPRNSAEDM